MSIDSLEKTILTAALVRLSSHFQQVIDIQNEGGEHRQLIPAFITSNDKYNVYENIRQKQNVDKPIQLPFIGMSLDNISIDREGSAKVSGSHYRMSNKVPTDDSNYLFAVIKSIPVAFDCNVMFLTDDFWQMLAFCSKWMLGTHDKHILNFTVVWHGIAFSIRVDLIDSVSFPQKDNTLDIPNLFEFNSTLKIHAFVTGNTSFKDLPTLASVRKIVVTPALVSGEYSGLQFLNDKSSLEKYAIYVENQDSEIEQLIIEK